MGGTSLDLQKLNRKVFETKGHFSKVFIREDLLVKSSIDVGYGHLVLKAPVFGRRFLFFCLLLKYSELGKTQRHFGGTIFSFDMREMAGFAQKSRLPSLEDGSSRDD